MADPPTASHRCLSTRTSHYESFTMIGTGYARDDRPARGQALRPRRAALAPELRRITRLRRSSRRSSSAGAPSQPGDASDDARGSTAPRSTGISAVGIGIGTSAVSSAAGVVVSCSHRAAAVQTCFHLSKPPRTCVTVYPCDSLPCVTVDPA